MAKTAAEAKLRFLEASARHYASSAPETSAHLMALRNVEAFETDASLNKSPPSGSCRVCGSILIPGWTSRTSVIRKGGETKRLKVRLKNGARMASRNKSRIRDADWAKFLRIDCLICYRYEETPLQVPKATSKHPLKVPSKPAVVGFEPQLPPSPGDNPSTTSTSQAQPSKPLANNTSSKRRAKARKQSGLQAMLEKSKTSTSPASGFGLNLLDLMKQG